MARTREGGTRPDRPREPGRASSRPSWLPWAVAGGLAALASLLTFDPKLYINGDNVDYMFLARSLRGGDFWPSDKYPPLFPLILSGAQLVFGLRLIPQKILVLLFYFGSVWMLARILRRRYPGSAGPVLLFLCATLIPVVEYSHYVMSEVPFLFFLLGAIDALDRLPAENGSGRVGHAVSRAPRSPDADSSRVSRLRSLLRPLPSRSIWIVALWSAGAFYVRTAGAALGVALVLALLLSRRRSAAVSLVIALAVTAIPWLLHSLLSPGGNPYRDQILLINPYYPEFGYLTPASLWRRVSENAVDYLFREVPAMVFPIFYSSTYSAPGQSYLPSWMSALLLAPFGIGMFRGLRRGDGVAAAVLMTLVMMCLWPLIWTGSRYLIPVVPLLLLLWWQGWTAPLSAGARPAPWSRGLRPLGLWFRRGLLGVLVLLALRNLVFYREETSAYPPVWDHYFQALNWIRENTPADAVVMDRKPAFVRYVAERKSVNFPREKDPDRMLAAFREYGATHVVLPAIPYDDIGRYLRPVVEQRRAYFDLLWRLPEPNTYVLGFRPKGDAVPPSPGSAVPRDTGTRSGSSPEARGAR